MKQFTGKLATTQLNRLTAVVNCSIDETLKTMAKSLYFEAKQTEKKGIADFTFVNHLDDALKGVKLELSVESNKKDLILSVGEGNVQALENDARFLGFSLREAEAMVRNFLSSSRNWFKTSKLVEYKLEVDDRMIFESLDMTRVAITNRDADGVYKLLRMGIKDIIKWLASQAFLTGSYMHEISIDEDEVRGCCAILADAIFEWYHGKERDANPSPAQFVIE